MRNILLLLISLLIATLMGEVVVRIVAPQDLSGTWRVETSDGLRLNRSKGAAVHQFGEIKLRYHFGHPHLRVSSSAGSAVEPAIRVLVLGDSFTFGWLVEAESSFVGRWQARADETFGVGCVAFLNAGSGGWSTADQLAYLQRFGNELSPRLVISVLNRYDVDRSLRTRLYVLRSGQLLRTPRDRRSGLKRMINAIPGYQWMLEHSHLLQLIRRAGIESSTSIATAAVPGDFEMPDASGRLHEFGRQSGRLYYAAMGEAAREMGAGLAVVTTGWPAPAEATQGFLASAPEWFARTNTAFHDSTQFVASAIGNQLEALTIPQDSHPTAEGHRVIAEGGWSFIHDQLKPLVDQHGGPQCSAATSTQS